MSRKLAVIAIGGNSLIKHRDKQSVEDQYLALCETMEHIADVIQQGWQVLITHGNGPQVGFIMLRSEIARAVAGMHIVPLVSCVADTQGAIGYQIQQSLDNVLKRRGLTDKTGRTVSLVTQVRVDDLAVLLRISLPPEWRDRGKESGRRLRAMRCQALAMHIAKRKRENADG